jgi:hypothetical protein
MDKFRAGMQLYFQRYVACPFPPFCFLWCRVLRTLWSQCAGAVLRVDSLLLFVWFICCPWDVSFSVFVSHSWGNTTLGDLLSALQDRAPEGVDVKVGTAALLAFFLFGGFLHEEAALVLGRRCFT